MPLLQALIIGNVIIDAEQLIKHIQPRKFDNIKVFGSVYLFRKE